MRGKLQIYLDNFLKSVLFRATVQVTTKKDNWKLKWLKFLQRPTIFFIMILQMDMYISSFCLYTHETVNATSFSFQNTRGQWQIVFYISAAVYLTGCVLFNLFARGEEQSWNCPEVSVLVFKGNAINERDRSESAQESISSRLQS